MQQKEADPSRRLYGFGMWMVTFAGDTCRNIVNGNDAVDENDDNNL
jgi:hypothetical protein